jgi:3-methyladenine DNA glycosylase AlkD
MQRRNQMTVDDIVAELTTLGTAQTKKTWMNHGAQEPCLGVKIEDMKKIKKRVKMDYQLALDLYDSGIADAMYLAGLIADDAKMTKKNLQKWIEAANTTWVAEYTVPWVASASPHGREMALKWMASKVENIAAAGWQTYSSMVAIMDDAKLDLAEIESLLARVAESITQQPNRVKYVMNGFVIAVACYVKALHQRALDTAKAIGKVDVALVGACKIPFAPEQIQKFAARSAIGKKRKSPKC